MSMKNHRKNEVWAVVAPWETKRAALLFDRIYRWPKYSGASMGMVEGILITPLAQENWRPPEVFSFGSKEDDKIFEKVWQHFEMKMFERMGDGEGVPDPDVFSGAAAEILNRNSVEAASVVCSGTGAEIEKGFKAAMLPRYEAVLRHIPIVNPECLEWEHVIQFRNDENSVRKYRDLRLWLTLGMNAQSVDEAEDLIGQKIDDYKDAVKTWGLETAIGSIKQLFDLKNLATNTAAGVAGVTIGGPIGAAITAGLSIGTQTALFVAERLIDLQKAKAGHREIAILFDIEEEFVNS